MKRRSRKGIEKFLVKEKTLTTIFVLMGSISALQLVMEIRYGSKKSAKRKSLGERRLELDTKKTVKRML